MTDSHNLSILQVRDRPVTLTWLCVQCGILALIKPIHCIDLLIELLRMYDLITNVSSNTEIVV